MSGSGKRRLPPKVKQGIPVVGGLLRFLKGPIVMLREEYPKLGSVFTLNLVNRNITFLIGPEVSAHFFKAPEADLSQQEVYQFNVPTFGPGVVFDVDYSIRQEQFRFFTESLRVNKLKGYVDMMVTEAQVRNFLVTPHSLCNCCNFLLESSMRSDFACTNMISFLQVVWVGVRIRTILTVAFN
ncbi:unnamed protein product [Linum tenue]|uniref:Cytochrome P450 n=1 Tax=Linum tenue TaxID=586396 RepID=A0AAV0RF60_9ROSI|nr:unnamed protein product [Linum tenue]